VVGELDATNVINRTSQRKANKVANVHCEEEELVKEEGHTRSKFDSSLVETLLVETLRINFKINLLFLCNNNVKNNNSVFHLLCNSFLLPPHPVPS